MALYMYKDTFNSSLITHIITNMIQISVFVDAIYDRLPLLRYPGINKVIYDL